MMNKNKIYRTAIVIGVSLLIVASGILVPFALLANKSRAKNLPHGSVDAENIQPYGADAIRIENSLVSASDRLVSDGGYPTMDVTGTWIATKDNEFSEIGIQNRLYDEGYSHSPEFINALNEKLEIRLGTGLGDTVLVSSTADIDSNDQHPLYHISAQDNKTQIILDGNTGIPILANISIVTPYSIDRASLRSEIIGLYQEYTGLDFVYLNSDPGQIDEYDSYYLYQIENTDHKVRLTIVIESGWYWLPPDETSEEWQPTDDYIWTISIYCNEIFDKQ